LKENWKNIGPKCYIRYYENGEKNSP